MKGYVDQNTCIGCGICPEVCPEIFRMNDDGKAEAVDIEITDEIMDNAKDAETQCPVDAIEVK